MNKQTNKRTLHSYLNYIIFNETALNEKNVRFHGKLFSFVIITYHKLFESNGVKIGWFK